MVPDATVNAVGVKVSDIVVPLVYRITVDMPVIGFPDKSTEFTDIVTWVVLVLPLVVAEDVADGELVPTELIADTL